MNIFPRDWYVLSVDLRLGAVAYSAAFYEKSAPLWNLMTDSMCRWNRLPAFENLSCVSRTDLNGRISAGPPAFGAVVETMPELAKMVLLATFFAMCVFLSFFKIFYIRGNGGKCVHL